MSPPRNPLLDGSNQHTTTLKSFVQPSTLLRILLLGFCYGFVSPWTNNHHHVVAFSTTDYQIRPARPFGVNLSERTILKAQRLRMPTSSWPLSSSSENHHLPLPGVGDSFSSSVGGSSLLICSKSGPRRSSNIEPPPPIVQSRRPHQLANGRGTFLGFRNVKDLSNHHHQRSLSSSSSSSLQSSVQALMPDGGLSPCVIRVLGVGGGGCNAVDRMLEGAVGGVEYWAINTDAQALGRSKALGAKVLNIGASVTRGLGAGGDPEIGRLAAEESREDIAAMIQGTDLCFITSGMGGGTGSGAAPVVSEIAKESGALTIAIVTKPFAFEGRRRMRQATDAINRLRENVDTVIVVSNNKLLEIIPDDTPVTAAFRVADDILRQGVVGISEIIVRPGLINVDFADVRSIMKDAGTALMGIGTGVGKTSAEDAAIAAISSPLLDEPVQDATGVVFNILGPRNLSLQEVNRAARVIYENVHEDANVIFGALVDDDIQDEVSITVLATGFGAPPPPPAKAATSTGKSYSNISRSTSSRSVDFPDFLSERK